MVLSEWEVDRPHDEAFTTVMNWTSYEPLVHDGITYGQKDIELQRFVTLPSRIPGSKLEVALASLEHVNWQTRSETLPPDVRAFLDRHPTTTPRQLLEHFGWSVVDAQRTCSDLDSYRDYILRSKGEWSIAKHGYVAGQAGWFSCRSACYLAAGRPVVVQDTGFTDVLPSGEGILTFSDIESAQRALEEVGSDYARHATAARSIAVEYFDSSKVLSRLVEAAMASSPSNLSAAALPDTLEAEGP